MGAVYWKELRDHFSSRRFLVVLGMVVLAALWSSFVALRTVRSVADQVPEEFAFLTLFTTRSPFLPSFVTFLSFFGPLLGIALGFDAISGERAGRTLARVLAQPIYRDDLINGKFLAGLTAVAVVWASLLLMAGGLGTALLGFPPTLEELGRLAAFYVVGVAYIGFWLAVSILFSLVLGRSVASALAGLGLWLFAGFFMQMVAGSIADLVVPDPATEQLAVRHTQVEQMVLRASPATLFTEATVALLTPTVRALGPLLTGEIEGIIPNPLSLGQSLLLVWPHIVTLFALTALCFGIAYARFLREEVRA